MSQRTEFSIGESSYFCRDGNSWQICNNFKRGCCFDIHCTFVHKYKYCYNYQNTTCSREMCPFIHVTSVEQARYEATGKATEYLKQEMSHLYKVWTADRKKKISLILRESDNMLSELIEKSNTKLDIAGSVLVMEKDGTIVDDNEVVKFCFVSRKEHFFHTRQVCNLLHRPHLKHLIIKYNCLIWKNFQIPWDKLEMSVIKELENESRSKAMTAVVNRIVSEMRNIQEFIPAKAFKIIAEQIVSKYPKTFKDMDEDGKCFEDGSHTLFAKLRDRNNYLRVGRRHGGDAYRPDWNYGFVITRF
ncbi:uncharacterized protein [Temnothorax nylanderi]|uniref:uncharacterized protein n=1 Tax=Temnothorax nylanderi TaxID=102681 RepID=UPI003A89B912